MMQVDFQHYHDKLVQDIEQIFNDEVKLSYHEIKTANFNKVMMNEWIIKIKGDGIFLNKMFTFLIVLANKEPDVFPKKAPLVYMLQTSKDYQFVHPNVYNYLNGRAEVCLAVIDKWSAEESSIIELINALKDFLLNPNMNDLANFDWAKKKDQFEQLMKDQLEKLDDWE
ncbi:hypothetical protein pb186bvf_016666 [Paramecium bursaria]